MFSAALKVSRISNASDLSCRQLSTQVGQLGLHLCQVSLLGCEGCLQSITSDMAGAVLGI